MILASSSDRPELIEASAVRSFNKQSNTSHRDDVILFPHLFFIHNFGDFSPTRLCTSLWLREFRNVALWRLFIPGGAAKYLSQRVLHSLTHSPGEMKLLQAAEVLDLREMILNSQFVIFIPNSIVALSAKPSLPN